jgi:hypothetical protein
VARPPGLRRCSSFPPGSAAGAWTY